MWCKLGTWVAVLALCVGATFYEMPNVSRVRRFHAQIGGALRHNAAALVPASITAQDPEAGDILRHYVQGSVEDPNIVGLAALARKYPQNELFPYELARRQMKIPHADYPPAPDLADRLIALNPSNACYRYLRGWIVLEGPEGPERVKNALAEFEAGHRLPQFYQPYSLYKPRIDRLCEEAVLGYYDRPRIWPFYWELITLITHAHESTSGFDTASFDRLTASASTMAGRMIESPHDNGSLTEGIMLQRVAEAARLRNLDLTEEQARQTRFRLSQALALDDMNAHWPPDSVNLHLISLSAHAMMYPLCYATVAIVFAIGLRLRRTSGPDEGRRRTPLRATYIRPHLLCSADPEPGMASLPADIQSCE